LGVHLLLATRLPGLGLRRTLPFAAGFLRHVADSLSIVAGVSFRPWGKLPACPNGARCRSWQLRPRAASANGSRGSNVLARILVSDPARAHRAVPAVRRGWCSRGDLRRFLSEADRGTNRLAVNWPQKGRE